MKHLALMQWRHPICRIQKIKTMMDTSRCEFKMREQFEKLRLSFQDIHMETTKAFKKVCDHRFCNNNNIKNNKMRSFLQNETRTLFDKKRQKLHRNIEKENADVWPIIRGDMKRNTSSLYATPVVDIVLGNSWCSLICKLAKLELILLL